MWKKLYDAENEPGGKSGFRLLRGGIVALGVYVLTRGFSLRRRDSG
jgi:hypothetical protein